MHRTLFALALLLVAAPAHAQDFSVRTVTTGTLNEVGRAYILGMGQGLELANAQLRGVGKAPIYCIPDGVSLSAGDYVDFVREWAARTSDADQQRFDVAMAAALVAKYPCR